jgi:hypothetical protein
MTGPSRVPNRRLHRGFRRRFRLFPFILSSSFAIEEVINGFGVVFFGITREILIRSKKKFGFWTGDLIRAEAPKGIFKKSASAERP